MVRYSWILTRRMKLFLLCFSLGWSGVGAVGHTCFRQPLLLLLPGSWTSWFQMSKKKVTKKLVRAGQNSPLKETQLSVSLNWLPRKKDGTTPIGWWLQLESQHLLFSWHGRFCQTNFFVSNIDVWKWRNWWWLSQECLRYCHFCTFLNTLETGFVQTYSLVSSVL